MEKIELLVKELLKRDIEDPCVEFKDNNTDPNMIGEYISISRVTGVHGNERQLLRKCNNL